jgi:hypothetical protein
LPYTLPVAIAAGVLVDADHLIDTLDKRDGDTNLKIHMWRPFHAWEYVAVGLALFLTLWNHPLFLAFLLGYTSHLVLDNITNVVHPLAYSIIFRASRGFRRRRLTPHLFDPRNKAVYTAPVPFWGKVEPTIWRLVSRRRNKRR